MSTTTTGRGATQATTAFERAVELVAAGRHFALATVVSTHGSTPQTVGAKLIVTDDPSERPFGTLGGGCVEADALIFAREVLVSAEPVIREHQLTEELAWNTGLVCGGTMWILAEHWSTALTVEGRDLVPEISAATQGGDAVAIVTKLERRSRALALAGRVAVLATGARIGSFGSSELDSQVVALALDQISRGTSRLVTLNDGDQLLIEPIVCRPHLVIAGGGHVAKAIARQARLLDFDVTVMEDRPEFASPERFDGADVVPGHVPESIATFEYDSGTYLVIATRGHKLDADCVLAAVKTNVPYIGLLGSRRKTLLIAEMLRNEGVNEERIAAIRAPVGLDLGGRTPAEIALSVLAEISQVRHGGSAKPLSQR